MTTTEPEIQFSIRRADGEAIGDEWTFVGAKDADDWSGVEDEDSDEPVEFEMVRMELAVVDRKTFGGPQPVCDTYSGSELPFRSSWRILIPASGDPNVFPAGGREVVLTFSDTEDEARSILDALPETIFVHHVGASYSPVEKSSLYIECQEQEAFVPACRTCGHPKAAHDA